MNECNPTLSLSLSSWVIGFPTPNRKRKGRGKEEEMEEERKRKGGGKEEERKSKRKGKRKEGKENLRSHVLEGTTFKKAWKTSSTSS